MCLIFIALNQHPDFPVIIAANRDEFFERPTVNAAFWEEHPSLLAGRDLQAGGTWLGITRNGRFAAITNVREPSRISPPNSRGKIATSFLLDDSHVHGHLSRLKQQAAGFAGFNCIIGHLSDTPDLHFFSNRSPAHIPLASEVHGLSNASLDTPWPKVTSGKKRIRQLMQQDFDVENWMAMLRDQQMAPDALLPETGIGTERERLLSSRFIQTNDYGTRCSTVITVSHDLTVSFTEDSFNPAGIATRASFRFKISP